MKVSVVILNWNGSGYLKKFLPIVLQYSNLPETEIVVADNASSDDSVEVLNASFKEVRLIQFDKNYGFAEGYNKALKQLDSQYYILLNSDVEVTENWIKPIIEFMDSNTSIGACMPKLKSYDNRNYFEYAGAAGGFIDKYGYPFCRGRVFNSIEKDLGQYNDTCNIFWATGACMFVRAKSFWEAGGLDPLFFAHMEEIDLCWRLQWLGYEIKYFHQVEVYHVGGGALPKENPYKTYLNFRNNLFLLYKNLPTDILYKTLTIRFMLDFVAGFYSIVNFRFIHFLAIIRAHKNFFNNLTYLKLYRKQNKYLDKSDKFFCNIFYKSVIIEYFFRGRKTYGSLFMK
jgi:GT2 family glycosyltransferase